MYKICVFLFFLQMTVAKPQGDVNIPPETTVAESTTKHDVELISDGTTKSGNISSETVDVSSDTDSTTISASTSVDVNNATITQESSSSEGSNTDDTTEETTDENCDKDNEEVIDIIVIEPLFPPFFKK